MRMLIALIAAGLLAAVPAAAAELMLATTTSTDNTGLLDELAPAFESDTGITLKWVAVGTGRALALGQNCDADALLVHAPGREKTFVDNGYGVMRTTLMFNDFIIVAPPSVARKISQDISSDGDPAIAGIRKIASEKIPFISRGDDSGTHTRERGLWSAAGIDIPGRNAEWYIESGQGMLATLNMAAERQTATLTDRGTFIKFASTRPDVFDIAVEGGDLLKNTYSAIAINTEHCPNVDFESAKAFIDWMSGERAQTMIRDYKLMGKRLFTPLKLK